MRRRTSASPRFTMRSSASGMLQTKRSCLRIAFVSVCFALVLLWSIHDLHLSGRKLVPNSESENASTHLPCWNLPGANETLLVLRTGATEIQDRVPVHTSTTLRCFPHHLIFSDVEEDFAGEHVLDAFESVNSKIRAHHPDFELYRRLQQGGRAILASHELSGSDAKVASGSGELENPGWKLDKWKFLPMLNRTLYEYPHMKWYVFVEADTLMLWSMLQKYLAVTDPSQPLYAGYLVMIGPDKFAHGGTGFFVSQPALRTIIEYYAAHKADLEVQTDEHWAGDCILGRTFEAAGVSLTNMKPILQGNHPGAILYGRPDGNLVLQEPTSQPQIWCSPTMSYHHMSSAEIEGLWQFEQRWLETGIPDVNILRHKDVFKHYVMPQMTVPREDWDNLSDEDVEDNVGSFEECRAPCEAKDNCKQYSYDADGHCRHRVNPRLGAAKEGITSGWVMERVTVFEQNMTPCEDKGTWSTEPW